MWYDSCNNAHNACSWNDYNIYAIASWDNNNMWHAAYSMTKIASKKTDGWRNKPSLESEDLFLMWKSPDYNKRIFYCSLE